MDWLFEPLPTTLGFIMGGSFAAAVLTIAVTRLRGTWLATLAGANMAIIVLWALSLSYFEPAPWRLQVVVQRLTELPLVGGLAILCVVQARRLPRSESRLAKILLAAPVVLACAWGVAFVGEQAWPRPVLSPFAEMPVRNWALLTLLCLPFQFYLWSIVFLFVRGAGSRSPTFVIRAQNLFLAAAVGGYGLASLNVLAGYAVLTFLDNPVRRDVTLVQYVVEERLFLVWGPALLVGLLLAVSPAATREAARATDALVLLPLRERFEGLTWRLEATGSLRRLTRPLYYLRCAASDLGLSESDTAKASQAVKLAAIMGSSGAPSDLSREKARELLLRLEASGTRETVPIPPVRELGIEAGTATDSVDYLPDILDAALSLSSPVTGQHNLQPTDRPAWFELARVACTEAGIPVGDVSVNANYHRAFDAYHAAADSSHKSREYI